MEQPGQGALYMMLTRDFLKSTDLSLESKVVYRYLVEMAPYRYPGETGPELLNMPPGRFKNCLSELLECGYLTKNEYKNFIEKGV